MPTKKKAKKSSKPACRKPHLHEGAVSVPREYWKRIVDHLGDARFADAEGTGTYDKALHVHRSRQLFSDLVALRIGEASRVR